MQVFVAYRRSSAANQLGLLSKAQRTTREVWAALSQVL
jgi:hypothetical protein